MAEMDDLTDFFKSGSGTGPTNLDWLHVNEKDYQALDRLPKQNLDITPDLKALWSHEDKPSTGFVPNTGGPRTMGDLSQSHGMLRNAPEDLIKTARLAIMQSTDPQRIQHAIQSRYDMEVIRGARTALASVLAERGLLGGYYIDASDFPDCASGSKKAADFARRFANEARFVKVKTACGGCIHRQGGNHCGVFHKELVLDVPYTEGLAVQVEGLQQAKGKPIQASADPPKVRIQRALLAQGASVAAFSGRSQAAQKPIQASAPDQLIAVENLTKKRVADEQQRVAAQQARPIVASLRREMLKGRSKTELNVALRLAFDERDLRATRAEWGPLYKQAGLFGALYTTQDAFDDCREGSGFLAKHGSSTKAVVAGEKCGSCIFNKVGRCLMYGKPLIRDASEVLTPQMLAQVLDEHRFAGRLPMGSERRDWGPTPAVALAAIHEAVKSPRPLAATSLRSTVERAHHMQTQRQAGGSDLAKRSVVKAMAEYMNEGLYGQDLATLLKSRFEVRDLAAAREEMRTMLAEQGLQGIVYIDPRVYDDYGNGCKEAARKHRSRAAVKYAKVGDKCASCVHQSRPGHCSVLSKQLVVEPPYTNKAAEQRAILATGRATEVAFGDLVNNGLSMLHEYQMQRTAEDLELNPTHASVTSAIEFGFGSQEVKL